MTIIKKIVMWIISLFQMIFGKKKTSKLKSNNRVIDKIDKNNSYNNVTLPIYMSIPGEDKLILINNIKEAKKRLTIDSLKANEIAKIVKLLNNGNINNNGIKEYLNKDNFDKLNSKKVNVLLNDCDDNIRKEVCTIVDNYHSNVEIIKETSHSLDGIIDYVKNHDISIETSNLINNELDNLSITDNNQTVMFNKDILNVIKNWDKTIIDEVKLEYQKVNYVTISTVIIDKIINQYDKVEDDYRHHRFNKLYYERELNKIKEQIDYLKKIKNTKIVYQEIEKLRKELYTKSKDKYDILYNNEIFMNVNRKCDELLNKVNQRVIDIKKEEIKDKKKEEKKEKENKEEYLKKIILRFQDVNLSRQIILNHIEKESEILDYKNISAYYDAICLEFINGVSDDFNYQRNKTKTELVKFYNDLNNIISHNKKDKPISIDHINFRMEDLVEAVKTKKNEVETKYDLSRKVNNSDLVDEKILNIEKKFLPNEHEKVLKKTS